VDTKIASGSEYFHPACDGHHEMSDLGAAGEPVHNSGESVEPVWPHISNGRWEK
jgi:hypothetical protein